MRMVEVKQGTDYATLKRYCCHCRAPREQGAEMVCVSAVQDGQLLASLWYCLRCAEDGIHSVQTVQIVRKPQQCDDCMSRIHDGERALRVELYLPPPWAGKREYITLCEDCAEGR